MASIVERLVNYLKMIGSDVKFVPCDFSDPRDVKYARIEVTTYQPIADGLESFIADRLSSVNGYDASLHFIGMKELGHGRVRYETDIIPLEYLKSERERVEATEKFLASLPKVIASFRQLHPSKNRRHK